MSGRGAEFALAQGFLKSQVLAAVKGGKSIDDATSKNEPAWSKGGLCVAPGVCHTPKGYDEWDSMTQGGKNYPRDP